LWNTDAPVYQRGADPLYYNIPFYLGIHSQSVYGVFWDNSNRGMADLGVARNDTLTFEAESGELRYYLFAGADVKRVLSRYTELTGRISLPPLWSLGYHQSRFSYQSRDVVLQVAEEFRNRGIPCDAIHLDVHYMDGFRLFTWDTKRFPQYQEMLDKLHAQGFKVVAHVPPGVKVDNQFRLCLNGIERDIFLHYPDGKLVLGPEWSGICHFPDFTHPAARAWWNEQMAPFLRVGIDGICNNMGEPAIFTQEGSATLPDYVQHQRDGLGGTHLESHNVYGLLMGRSSMEALQKHRAGLRPFNIIRAGFAGAQRFGSSWTGNNVSDWDHLRLSISMALNMGLSGAPFTGPDVGGFQKDCSAELFTRWLQAASLLPFFRSHSALGTAAQEPWAFGQPYEVINRLTITWRYRLLPYLYSVFAQAKEYGWPIVRPLFMAEPNNPHIRAIDDCYTVGDALLVAPVLQAGAVRRPVYLPVGEWYDFWTNELLIGGQVIDVPAPLERLPLFVRAGTILPLWPEIQYFDPQAIDSLVYRVYPGDSETVLYEDDGEGLAYEKGEYRWVYATCRWDESKLFIDRRVAGRYQPAYKSLRLEVVGLDEEPMQVRVDRQGAPLWYFDDDILEVTLRDDFQRVEIIGKPQPDDRTVVHRPW
ncbi:MAG TPA: TIM-barrel domain-containing protein, partial [Phototrophicaceae bacterium]|nr:TIM-barrel domain-containing protein [Phototrophicaceae bacterium]